jgi:hypothetical protein
MQCVENPEGCLPHGGDVAGIKSSGIKYKNISDISNFLHVLNPNCTELVFTVVILQILNCIYEIAIHSRVFILDLPNDIDV